MEIVPLPPDRAEDLFVLYDTYDRPTDNHLPEIEVASILDRIRQHGGEIFVATKNDQLIGTYSIYICQNLARNGRPFAVLENVICAPSHRRQGIGKALMNHAISYAQQLNCYKVFLQTGEARSENHTFYKACGFQGNKRGFQVRFGT